MVTFKKFFLKENEDTSIFPQETSSAIENWYIFKNGNQFILDKSPCSNSQPAIGSFNFSPYYEKINEIKLYSAAQLQLFTKEARIKKSLLHLARGKIIDGIEENYRSRFLSEMISKTTQILEKINPSTVVDIESTADFNKSVLSQYNQSRVLNYNSITKNNFNYIASKYVNPSVVRQELMANTIFLKGPEKDQVKPQAEIISIAYMNLLKDVKEGKEIIKKDKATTGETKLSIDLIASLLASNYIEKSKEEYLKTFKKGLPIEKIYGIDQINKWINSLKDARSIKEFLLPSNFFIFDKSFWQNPENNNIVILDDNINSHKTFVEINQRIKQLNPKLNIVWVVGIRFKGISVESLPRCNG